MRKDFLQGIVFFLVFLFEFFGFISDTCIGYVAERKPPKIEKKNKKTKSCHHFNRKGPV